MERSDRVGCITTESPDALMNQTPRQTSGSENPICSLRLGRMLASSLSSWEKRERDPSVTDST